MNSSTQSATFAAGCFWGVEDAFRQLPGVLQTSVGFTGGHWLNPSYLDVCGGMTGHVEAVQLEYDPKQISYDRLLEVFWSIHDPTKLDREGPDKGPQYRSMIFTHSPDQAQQARASKQRLIASGQYDRPIQTRIQPIGTFYLASDDHQHYYEQKRRRLG
jgi:peptide-methionine (S)-S-oxide reductase